MKLIRGKTPETPTRRQRLEANERMKVNTTFSYSSRRSDEAFNVGRHVEQARLKIAKTTNFWIQRIGLILLLVAALFALFNILSLSTNPKTLPLDTSNQALLTHDQKLIYQKAASQILSSSILNDNKITVDTGGLSRKLMAKFPQISSVSVTLPLLTRTPIIYIDHGKPTLILVKSNGAYVVDQNGRAMYKGASAQSFSIGNAPIVTDQSSLPVKLDSQVLPSTYIAFIQTVAAQLEAKNIQVSSLTLPNAASELYVGVVGQTYIIKFNLVNNDPRQQAGTFLATITQLQSQNITPRKYVDVRIDGRSYYL